MREIQLKLLTLIPIASGAAASVVVKGVAGSEHLRFVAILGFPLTLGLFLYSLRGTQHANALSLQGSVLEEKLDLPIGQFKDRPLRWTWIIGYTTASALMYAVVLMAWVYTFRLD